MGKKSKKQRKAERASKAVCEPKTDAQILGERWKHLKGLREGRMVFGGSAGGGKTQAMRALFAGIDPAAPGGDTSVSYGSGTVHESTLPSAFTDLLKVDKPKRYSTIPPHANHCKAEDRFEYLKGMRAGEPVAMRCPDCDVRLGFAQSRDTMFSRAFGGESFNRCRYCGVTYTFHGSRLVWWR